MHNLQWTMDNEENSKTKVTQLFASFSLFLICRKTFAYLLNSVKLGLVVSSIILTAVIFLFQIKTSVIAEKRLVNEEPGVSESLCSKEEQIIWSCTTKKNKIASVCASKKLKTDQGYVQYRFGKPGRVELELPKAKEGSIGYFRYSRYTRPLVTMLQLTFENDGYTYQIHNDDNSEEKPPIRSSMIEIIKSGSDKNSSIVCRNPSTGSLMKLEDIVPKDENGIQ